MACFTFSQSKFGIQKSRTPCYSLSSLVIRRDKVWETKMM
uniref:Uncharacterized protein n=1 Tax=Rhizophora mucronata TaxID=61149 RepID=A0A2P2Q3M7_RHIMU